MPDKVDHIEEFKIKWYVSLTDSIWNFVGESSNELFLTFNVQVNVAEMNKDLLYYTCTQAKGKSTYDEVFEAIWKPFKGRSMQASDFNPSYDGFLTYYKTDYVPPMGRYVYDKYPSNGECGDFTILLEDILGHQGFVCNRLVPTSKYDG